MPWSNYLYASNGVVEVMSGEGRLRQSAHAKAGLCPVQMMRKSRLVGERERSQDKGCRRAKEGQTDRCLGVEDRQGATARESGATIAARTGRRRWQRKQGEACFRYNKHRLSLPAGATLVHQTSVG